MFLPHPITTNEDVEHISTRRIIELPNLVLRLFHALLSLKIRLLSYRLHVLPQCVCTFLVTGCGKSRILQDVCRLLKFPPTHLLANEAFRLTANTLLAEREENGIGTRCEQCSQNKNGEVLIISPCFLEKSSLKTTEPSPHFLQHTLF